jgi:CheY-like chemotaxis protein
LVPFRVLIVKADPKASGAAEEALIAAGYHVSRVSDFDDAKMRLLFSTPDILVTDLRLGMHNGVHLLVYAHATNPAMPGIVLDTVADRVLETEVRNQGGVYVPGRCTDQELLTLVEDLTKPLSVKPSASVPREFPRKHTNLSATASGKTAKVVDVSYGGLRLEIPGLPNQLVEQLTSVEIPSIGTVNVRPVWARGAVSMPLWWCGAEIVSADAGTESAWRKLVDSINDRSTGSTPLRRKPH